MMADERRRPRVAAWRAECLERERRDFLLTLVAAAIVFPGYAIADRLLEPGLADRYAIYRAAGTAAFLMAFVLVRRTRSLVMARASTAAAILLAGAMVAMMLPEVDHFVAYLTGYSAFYWGLAMVSWPMRWSLALFALQLAAVLVAFARNPGAISSANQLGVVLFLVTAIALTTIAIHARRAAHRRAFNASFTLAERNLELEGTMASLRQTQARLVAQEKLSALGRMLAGLSHEINNPINVIRNNLDPVREHVRELLATVELARAASADDLAELRRVWEERELAWRATDLDDALDAMNAAVSHIQQIHRDLRAFIRGDVPDMASADVAEGLRATVSLLSRRLPAAVQLFAQVERLPAIACRPGQLNQVWMNLLRNALDAVGASGTVRVSARVASDRIEIAVEDSGHGVAPEIRRRLFEPFATTKGRTGGTGLGLATSYEIVQQHHGRLYLDESHAVGARFVVELPT